MKKLALFLFCTTLLVQSISCAEPADRCALALQEQLGDLEFRIDEAALHRLFCIVKKEASSFLATNLGKDKKVRPSYYYPRKDEVQKALDEKNLKHFATAMNPDEFTHCDAFVKASLAGLYLGQAYNTFRDDPDQELLKKTIQTLCESLQNETVFSPNIRGFSHILFIQLWKERIEEGAGAFENNMQNLFYHLLHGYNANKEIVSPKESTALVTSKSSEAIAIKAQSRCDKLSSIMSFFEERNPFCGMTLEESDAHSLGWYYGQFTEILHPRLKIEAERAISE
jgi:hypothetical protein